MVLSARKRGHPAVGFGEQLGMQHSIDAPYHDGWRAALVSTVERRPEQEDSDTREHCRAHRGQQGNLVSQSQAQIEPEPYWYYGILRGSSMVATDTPVEGVPLQPGLETPVDDRKHHVGNGFGPVDIPWMGYCGPSTDQAAWQMARA